MQFKQATKKHSQPHQNQQEMMMRESKAPSVMPLNKGVFVVTLALLLFAVGGAFLAFSFTDKQNLEEIGGPLPAVAVAAFSRIESNAHTTPEEEIAKLRLAARSAFVYDVANQRVLYEKNANESRPLASLTKLMTALVSRTVLSENALLTVDRASLAVEGDSGFFEFEMWRMNPLLEYMLMTSSNDGAALLARSAGAAIDKEALNPEAVFVSAMNKTASDLHLSSLEFYNPTGLDIDETHAGAFGSARDVGLLMAHIVRTDQGLLHATTLGTTTYTSESGFPHKAENTSAPLEPIPGFLGSKTGFTDLAGGNLVAAVDIGPGKPVVIVVMGSGKESRYSDMLALIEAVQGTR